MASHLRVLVPAGALLVLLGAAGGWLLHTPAVDPGIGELARIEASLSDARRETEGWKRKAFEKRPPPPADTTGASAAEPMDPEAIIPPGPLRERLADFHALLVRFREEARGIGGRSRTEQDAFWKWRGRRVHEAHHALHGDVMKNPAAYVEFLRGVSDPDHLHSLLGVLNPAERTSGGDIWSPRAYLDYPPELRSGLEGLLSSGSPEQRKTILSAVGDMTHHPEDLKRRLESMISDPDDGVRMRVLTILDQRDDSGLPDRLLPAVREIVARSTEPEILSAGYRILGSKAPPEMQDSFIERLASSSEAAHTEGLLSALHARLREMPEERKARFGEAIKAAAGRTPDPRTYASLLSAALQLPAAQRLGVYEHLRGQAPTAELNNAMDRILSMLRDGETRWNKLHNTLFP